MVLTKAVELVLFRLLQPFAHPLRTRARLRESFGELLGRVRRRVEESLEVQPVILIWDLEGIAAGAPCVIVALSARALSPVVTQLETVIPIVGLGTIRADWMEIRGYRRV